MQHGRIYTVLFMVVLSCIFGAAIAGLSILSQPTIERNEKLIERRAYIAVFGLGDVDRMSDDEVMAMVDARVAVSAPDAALVDPATGRSFTVLRAYEDDQRTRLRAIAFNFRGLGFWAPIEGWLALTPDRAGTVGIVITKQTETPGLGGRIQEEIFTGPFTRGVLVSAPAQADAKFIIISGTEPPENTEKARRHVMAITGATQTCMAMETILDNSLRAFNRAWDAQNL